MSVQPEMKKPVGKAADAFVGSTAADMPKENPNWPHFMFPLIWVLSKESREKADSSSAKAFKKWLWQHMVDLVTLSENRLYHPDFTKHGNVTVPKEALRLLIWHFWTRPPSKMPLSSGEKLKRDKVFIEFRKELDRRVATGEPYKQVLHELSKTAAATVSGYALSQHGRVLSIAENTAKRYIQSPGSKPGRKTRRRSTKAQGQTE